ncbi:hypothetical protein GGTG_11307 [Gaeumannomyces tritici R3-111a-1]|uniref:Uncharacterized protein n=1 Tax=Gaeumannomyces tritici (strain R3-111a-1) TaxID=644352 RepID=J3PCT9_GAET3|nr:hypothetical protein GGTG_11307 [Gaeumannomyces tritici R3-111a-1]EJT72059.1 hypothetical protein GGTG_11307 [Gaeumannomyces tritici R3-111a-1]
MKEFLDSDRVNFLVWRYLLEGNYRETAAKFQKEWHVREPHRHFDFAQHVKSHALVSVVNNGLLYNALEREFEKSQQAPRNALATAEEVSRGVFGPLVIQPPQQQQPAPVVFDSAAAAAAAPATAAPAAAAPEQGPESAAAPATVADEDEDATGDEDDEVQPPVEEAENTRKRQLQLTNGSPPVKRARLSNGCENGVATADATTAMEIDSTDNNHAYPSPLEVEQVVPPATRTFGADHGTQVDKVDELSPATIFLSMSADDAAAPGAARPATPPADGTPTRAQHNPIVLHCEWSPSDPSVLAAAGTDALARIWTISRPAAPDPVTGHVTAECNQPFESIMEDDVLPNASVTAMAWNWDGTAVAIATDSGNKARISIWAADGSQLLRFDVAEPPIIKLKWNPNNSSILAIAPDNDGAIVTVFDSRASNTVSYSLATHDIDANPLDAAWISEDEFLLCGGKVLESFQCSKTEIVSAKKYPTKEDDNFTQVQFDHRSKLVATASESGRIDLWDESCQRRSISAHSGSITSLTWQPLKANPADDERLLASGGEDGIIHIWNARLPENKPKWTMTMDPPVVALSFTPDGAFIAGATTDQILIWKVGEYSVPRASWSRIAHPGWLSQKPGGGGSSAEDSHSLCWDASGQKLAYGTNSLVAVISFR